MKSINEQLELINKLIEISIPPIDNLDIEFYVSIKHSLLSLKQKIDCDLDFFVAIMHKDTYAKFIQFIEQKNEQQSNH